MVGDGYFSFIEVLDTLLHVFFNIIISFLGFWFVSHLEQQVAITPLSLSPHIETDIQAATSDWISAALPAEQ